MIISHMAGFCRTGAKFEQCNISIFCLIRLDKISDCFLKSWQIIFKIDVLKILQYPQENTCIGVSNNNVAGLQPYNFSPKTPTQMFSCEYSKISRNSFLYRTPALLYFEQLQR